MSSKTRMTPSIFAASNPLENARGVLRSVLAFAILLLLTAPSMASSAQGAIVSPDLVAKSKPVQKPGKTADEISTSLQGLTDSPFNNDMVDGAAFIDKMLAATEAYRDYSFDYTMKVFKGKKTVLEQGVFYFKKQPRLIRLEETGDYKHGAVAVLGANGKVKAHLGGGMKMFVVELDPSSNMLRSANGHPMTDSDFHSLAVALKSFLKQGYSSQVTREAFDLKVEHERVFVVELRKVTDQSKIWKRIAVSARTHLPVQWWDYTDDGALWSHATWDGFKPNQQLADSVFSIDGDKDKNNAG
jgi:outer membrane lipoprotein-sorting protein